MRWLRSLVALLLLLPAAALAAPCPVIPYTFVNNQTADANQVNSNFAYLITCANNYLAPSGANTNITSLGGLTTPLSWGQGGTNVAFTGGANPYDVVEVNGANTGMQPGLNSAIGLLTSVSSGSGTTLLAASVVNGIVNRTGPATSFTDTTDTAANIVGAIDNAIVGQKFSLLYINGSTGTATIAGGTGVTMAGPVTVPPNSNLKLDGFVTNVTGGSQALYLIGNSNSNSLALLSTQVFSAQSSIAFTGLSGYATYKLVISNLSVGTSGAILGAQIGTGAGPTYQTTGYNNMSEGSNAATISSVGFLNASSTTYMGLCDASQLVSGTQLKGEVTLSNLNAINIVTMFGQTVYTNNNSSSHAGLNVKADNGASSAVPTAIKLLVSTGTMSGTVSLYGLLQ